MKMAEKSNFKVEGFLIAFFFKLAALYAIVNVGKLQSWLKVGGDF